MSKRIIRRRAALFREQGGLCYWCKRECVLIVWIPKRKVAIPRNLATLDHLRDRFHPGRQEPARGDKRYVMACWECNHERGRQSVRSQPIEELRKRSKMFNGEQHP